MAILTWHQDKNPVVRGASWKLAFYYYNAARGDINLLNCQADLEADGKVLCSTTLGNVLIDAPTGKITCTLTPAQSRAVEFTQSEAFFHLTFPSGEIRTIFKGRLPSV